MIELALLAAVTVGAVVVLFKPDPYEKTDRRAGGGSDGGGWWGGDSGGDCGSDGGCD